MENIQVLPSEADFKKSVGRYYKIKKVFKRKDPQLYGIFSALREVAPYVKTRNTIAHEKMCKLRRACLCWVEHNTYLFGKERPETNMVKNLAKVAHDHVLSIITHIHRGSKSRLEDLARLENAKVRDKNLLLPSFQNVEIGRAVGESYNVERYTKKHLPHGCGSSYRDYLTKFPMSNLGAEAYYDLVYKRLREDDPNSILVNGGRAQTGVMYCNEEERNGYKVTLKGDGLLRTADGELLDTSGMVSIATGDGFGIFVVDMGFNFYVGAHAVDKFHHSSFLAGDPVFSAGEICVHNGVLVGVTNKTGHYKSGAAELHRALLLLQKRAPSKGWLGGVGAGMDHVAVCDPFVGGKETWRSGKDVIDAKGDFKNTAMLAKPPMTKPKPDNMEFLASRVRPWLIF